jgi:hypothetical protein
LAKLECGNSFGSISTYKSRGEEREGRKEIPRKDGRRDIKEGRKEGRRYQGKDGREGKGREGEGRKGKEGLHLISVVVGRAAPVVEAGVAVEGRKKVVVGGGGDRKRQRKG